MSPDELLYGDGCTRRFGLHAAACVIAGTCCSMYCQRVCCLPQQVQQPETRGHPAERRPHHQGEDPAAADQILQRQ
eukprot:6158078-Pyramimonas_sp.AAC.1